MSSQPDLWSVARGESPKLGKQTGAVRRIMTRGDQEWWTFAQLRAVMLEDGIGISEAGVSARIRDLRKPPLGLIVDRTATKRKGIFAYRVRR